MPANKETFQLSSIEVGGGRLIEWDLSLIGYGFDENFEKVFQKIMVRFVACIGRHFGC